jgi:hypothetical protein
VRQRTLRERENPFDVEFFQPRGVSVDLRKGQFPSQSSALAFVGVEVKASCNMNASSSRASFC